jgi:hypothetical protein
MKKARAHIRNFLRYEPETGEFFWLRTVGKMNAGASAGGWNHGYRRIGFEGTSYLAHRLAWYFMTGEWAETLIDHRDLDTRNNRWSNLRSANHSLNGANCVGRGRFSKGVSLHRCGRFQAQIKAFGKNYYLGLYTTEEAAAAEYTAMAIKLFGEFARGKP